MNGQPTMIFPETENVETRPALFLVADADVDRSRGYIGVLFRHLEVGGAGGTRRMGLRESHFLMSSSEACELRDLLNRALAGVSAVAYH